MAIWSTDAAHLSHLSLVDNLAQSLGDSLYGFACNVSISNAIMLDTSKASTMSSSTATLTSSCIESMVGMTSSTEVLETCTTTFTSAPSSGADETWGTSDDDYGNLIPASGQPGENTGTTSITSDLGLNEDASGSPRLCGASVDMGAYEVQVGCSE